MCEKEKMGAGSHRDFLEKQRCSGLPGNVVAPAANAERQIPAGEEGLGSCLVTGASLGRSETSKGYWATRLKMFDLIARMTAFHRTDPIW